MPSTLLSPRTIHHFDDQAVRYWLAREPGEDPGALHVLQFEGGMSNPTFLIETASGARYVLRKKPPGELLPKAHAVNREYRIMAALADTPVRVPKMIAYGDDPAVIGV